MILRTSLRFYNSATMRPKSRTLRHCAKGTGLANIVFASLYLAVDGGGTHLAMLTVDVTVTDFED